MAITSSLALRSWNAACTGGALMRLLCALCVWIGVVGCGDSTSDAPGAAGAAGNDANADADAASAPLDYDLIDACDANEPCAESFAQLIESSSHNIHDRAARCVLAALRDRTPGRLRHDADHTFSNGSFGTRHVIVIGADGSVLHAEKSYQSGEMQSEAGADAERCELAAPSYFQGCIDALDAAATSGDDSAAWECLWGAKTGSQPAPLAWFADCQPAEPTCD